MKVGVLGVGNWGIALACHLAAKGIDTVAWGRKAESVTKLASERTVLSEGQRVAIPESLAFTSKFEEAWARDVVVVSVPAAGLADVVALASAASSQHPLVVSGVKGVEPSSKMTALAYLGEKLKLEPELLTVLSGPSFASDLIRGNPLSMVAASQSEKTSATIAELFSSKAVRVYTSTDPIGVEFGGITKNVIAIAAGVSDARGYGPSARAGLITRGLAEMLRLGAALGAKEKTLFGLSGLGDLVMTCSEDRSRNRTVGLRLGKGESLQQIVTTLGSVAEGVTSAPRILALAQSVRVDMPITEQVAKLLEGKVTLEETAKNLLSRPLRPEF